MLRQYCVLWGTLILDFVNESDARSMTNPKLVCEILGVSEWDGKGRSYQYPNGFLIVTHTGGEHYLSAESESNRDEWILHIRTALECHFANPVVTPYKPSKYISRPSKHEENVRNVICPIKSTPLNTSTTYSHRHAMQAVKKYARRKSMKPSKSTKRVNNDNNDSDSDDNDHDDEIHRNSIYDEEERVKFRIYSGWITSDPPYSSPAHLVCPCCSRGFSGSEYSQCETGPSVLQRGSELPEKMCYSCSLSQSMILWMKTLNYAHVSSIHALTPEVNVDTQKYKNTFKLKRSKSKRLDDAARLFEIGRINEEEFGSLRELDEDVIREEMMEESEALKQAVEAYGDDVPMLISLLMNPKATEKAGIIGYHYIVLKLLDIADNDPELIDFYLPQLIQVHIQAAQEHTMPSIIKVDELQQTLLAISLKYPQLGVKLAWSLLATIKDYSSIPGTSKITRAQLAASMCLLLQLEMVMTGVISSIGDTPECCTIAKVIQAAGHQQSEIANEMGVLFLSRLKLLELHQTEILNHRYKRRGALDKEKKDFEAQKEVSETNRQSAISINTTGLSSYDNHGDDGNNDGDIKIASCANILSHLLVSPSASSAASDLKGKMPDRWKGFSMQLDFVDKVTTVVDSLRFVDRPERSSTFARTLKQWDIEGALKEYAMLGLCGNAYLGWDPIAGAVEPLYRITKVLVDDCRVFRTKARAPSLIVCEVVRDDIYQELRNLAVNIRRDYDESGFEEDQEGVPERRFSDMSEGKLSGTTGYSKTSARTRTRSNDAGSPKNVVLPLDEISGFFEQNLSGVKTKIEIQAKVNEENSKEGDAQLQQQLQEAVAAKHNSDSSSSSVSESPRSPSRRGSSSTKERREFKKRSGSTSSKLLSTNKKTSSNMNFQSMLYGNTASPGGSTSNNTDGFNNNATDSDVESNTSSTTNGNLSRSNSNGNMSRNNSTGNFDGAIIESNATINGTSAAADKLMTSEEDENIDFLIESHYDPKTDSEVVQSAHRLLLEGVMDKKEFYQVLESDRKYREEFEAIAAEQALAAVQQSFGEPWHIKKQRVLKFHMACMPVGVVESSFRERIRQLKETEEKASRRIAFVDANDSGGGDDVKDQGSETSAGDINDEDAIERGLSLELQLMDTNAAETLHQPTPLQAWISTSTDHFDIDEEDDEQDTLHDFDRMRSSTSLTSMDGDHLASSDHQLDHWPEVDLRAFIVKSNDDLRQEMAVLQLMRLCAEIFQDFGLQSQLFLKPYRIVSTGQDTGLVEVLVDSMSLDALKKTENFVSLPKYFEDTYGSSQERLMKAKKNFVASLAAYSIFCHLLLIKDRHNGNILIDTDGHIIHIDFGFLLGIAPGGAFSLESAPFKLTEEMIEVMGGLESPLFAEFLKSFTTGFLALRTHANNIISTLEILCVDSPFPCFNNKDVPVIMEKMRGRFRCEMSTKEFSNHCLELIVASYSHYGTRQYDSFQYFTNGISI